MIPESTRFRDELYTLTSWIRYRLTELFNYIIHSNMIDEFPAASKVLYVDHHTKKLFAIYNVTEGIRRNLTEYRNVSPLYTQVGFLQIY